MEAKKSVHIPIEIKPSRSQTQLLEIKAWLETQPEWREGEEEEAGHSPSNFLIDNKGLWLCQGENKLAFHPSMALLRLINIQRGETDRFLAATQLREGDMFLDATLGLASDALMGAWAVGPAGGVIGLESSLELGLLIRHGLQALAQQANLPKVKNPLKEQAWSDLSSSARRISVIHDDHTHFLRCQPDHSVDVIYFDPMFKHTQKRSTSIQPLHSWANHAFVGTEVIGEACRVARKRVVFKDRKGSGELERLGFSLFPGGTYSQVDYGVINLS